MNGKCTGLIDIVVNMTELLCSNSALTKLETLDREIGNFEAWVLKPWGSSVLL